MMNLFAASGFLIGVVGVLASLVMFMRGRRRIHYMWGLFCLSLSVWGFGSYGIAQASTPEQAILFWRITTLGVIFIPILFTHIVYMYLHLKKRLWFIVFLYVLGGGLSVFSFVGHLVVYNVRFAFDTFYYIVPGPLFLIVALLYFVSASHSQYVLWRAHTKTRGVERAHVRYFFLGGALGFVSGGFNFFPVYNIDLVYPAIPNIVISLGTVVFSYAIIRLRLKDLRVVVRLTVFYIAFAIVIYISFFVFAGVLQFMWGNVFSSSSLLAGVLFAIGLALVYPRIQHILQTMTNQRLYAKTYDMHKTLETLSKKLSTIIELDALVSAITATIQEALGVRHIQILLLSPTDTRRGSSAVKISSLQHSPLTYWLQKTGNCAVLDEFQIIVRENAQRAKLEGLYDVLNEMKALGSRVCVPLIVRNSLIGVIALGKKTNNGAYTKDEMDLLGMMAASAAVAIENAQLYHESLLFGKRLQRGITQATHKLTAANKELKVLDKAKNEFISTASHQLYTPLTAAKWYVSMMLKGDYGRILDKQRPILENLQQSVMRLIHLSKSLLDITSIESGDMKLFLERVQLEEIVEYAIQDVQPQAEQKGLSLVFDTPDDMPAVIVDKDRTRQIMINLLDNAVKYTKHGSIDVQIKRIGEEFLEFSVTDTGRGLAEDEIPLLFKKFSRLSDARSMHTEGVGLGLYLVDRIVRAHNGSVGAASQGLGSGSTFFIRLPVDGSEKSLK